MTDRQRIDLDAIERRAKDAIEERSTINAWAVVKDVPGLTAEIRHLRRLLAEAASEIHCAGPVAHRIRVLKREHGERVERLERQLAETRGARDAAVAERGE